MQSNIYEALLKVVPDVLAAAAQHRTEAAVLAGLVLYALSCPVVIEWIKNRRK